MRSDFIQSDVQDANERRRQPVAAFNAAPTNPTESFASFLVDPRELSQQRAQTSALVAVAPPGPPASPFKGISAFTGSPAVIPSAVTPPVEALVETAPAAPDPGAGPTATEPPASFAAAQPTPAETAAPTPAAAPETPMASPANAPALNSLSARRQPTPAFAAAKTEIAQAPAAIPTESFKGNAAIGARGLTIEESAALANGDASMTPKGPSLFGEEGMTTADFFSVINPLQHLPLVGALYREITGDTIKPGARILGGMLFGGPMGMVSGGFNAALESEIGTDSGGALLAVLRGKPIGAPADSNLASAPRPTPEAAAETVAGAAAPGALPSSASTASPTLLTPASANAVAQAPAAAPGPTPAPLPVSAQRVYSPPKQPAPAEARVITPSSTPSMAVAAEESKPADAGKSAIPVSFAPAAPQTAGQPPAAGTKDFALGSSGKEFPVPARMNNVQPRQPVPVVRADLSRARELAPMAPLTARSESPRPDHTPSPAQLLTPGLTPSGLNPSGLMTPGLTPGAASNVPLGVPGLPQNALPDAMTRALDKYDALLKSRKGGVVNQQS